MYLIPESDLAERPHASNGIIQGIIIIIIIKMHNNNNNNELGIGEGTRGE
jgi:hypothetical protein